MHQLYHTAAGLAVVALPLPHLRAAGLSLTARCGSRHDPPALGGLSHLLEHMMMRGGRRLRGPRQLGAAMEAAGGQLDAGTWRDQMEFSSQLRPACLEAALAAVADLAIAPGLRGLGAERGVVAAELAGELAADGSWLCPGELVRQRAWRGHPLGQPILGAPGGLGQVDAGQLRAHHARHFVAGNMALAVAGPLPPGAVFAAAERAFAQLPPGPALAPRGRLPPHPPTGLQVVRRPDSQCTLLLTFVAPADVGHQLAAARLLASILEEGPAACLTDALCNRRGWAYELSCGLDCYADAGLIEIEVQLAGRQLAAAAQLILALLERLAAAGPTPAQLQAAQRRLMDSLIFSQDDALATAQRASALALAGGPLGLADELAALRAVSARQVAAAAHQMFVAGPRWATALGPVPDAQAQRLAELVERRQAA